MSRRPAREGAACLATGEQHARRCSFLGARGLPIHKRRAISIKIGPEMPQGRQCRAATQQLIFSNLAQEVGDRIPEAVHAVLALPCRYAWEIARILSSARSVEFV